MFRNALGWLRDQWAWWTPWTTRGDLRLDAQSAEQVVGVLRETLDGVWEEFRVELHDHNVTKDELRVLEQERIREHQEIRKFVADLSPALRGALDAVVCLEESLVDFRPQEAERQDVLAGLAERERNVWRPGNEHPRFRIIG